MEGWAICQCLGDAVFIPAGAPHQVGTSQPSANPIHVLVHTPLSYDVTAFTLVPLPKETVITLMSQSNIYLIELYRSFLKIP